MKFEKTIREMLRSSRFGSGSELQKSILIKEKVPIKLKNYRGTFEPIFIPLTKSIPEHLLQICAERRDAYFLGISGALNVYNDPDWRTFIDKEFDSIIFFPQFEDDEALILGRGPSYVKNPKPWYLSTGSKTPKINGDQILCYFIKID